MPVQENKGAIGKIGGGMFIMILIILFFAAHGGSNEMMYIALLFVFIVIALFSYGFWSAVSRGEGVWQYVGKHNLQHQQLSNPHYHFGSVRNYKSNPHKAVHLCAPPKMGGARLNIYTVPLDSELKRNPSVGSDHKHLSRHSLLDRSQNNRNSFRKKINTNEEQIKVEVYSDSNDRHNESKDIHSSNV